MGSSGPLLDAEFFTREPIRQALARYDFGERQLRDITIIARVATRLGIPPELLGFDPYAATVEEADTDETREVDWVRRRDSSWVVAGTVLGLGVDALDIDRLAALPPTGPAESTTARIGSADVAAIEQATELFRRWDYSHGSGLCRPTAVAQLRSVLPLLDTASTTEVREQLLVATADLGWLAAWASYDGGHHDDARRLFTLALRITHQAEHPRAADLTARLLMSMTSQARYLDRPGEALSLVQLGYATATHRTQPLPASTASYLASSEACCHAALGNDSYTLAQTTADPKGSAPAAAGGGRPRAGLRPRPRAQPRRGQIQAALAMA